MRILEFYDKLFGEIDFEWYRLTNSLSSNRERLEAGFGLAVYLTVLTAPYILVGWWIL